MKRSFFLLLLLPASFITLSSQNVGIGNANPNRGKLDVVGVAGVGNTNAIFGSNANGISLQQNSPTIGFNQFRDNTAGTGKFMSDGYAAIQFLDPVGGGMYIDMLGTGFTGNQTGSGNRAIAITKEGNIGIRNNGGGATITVGRGDGNNTAIFIGSTYSTYINNSSAENTFIRAGKANGVVYINDGVPGSKVVMGGSDTYVGINSFSPAYPLEITQVAQSPIYEHGLMLRSPLRGNSTWQIQNNISFAFIYNNVFKASINSGDGQYYALSDARQKTNIQAMPDLLEKVKQLRTVSYEMKDNNPDHAISLGFIAQEVKSLFPQLVTEKLIPLGNNEFGNRYLMNYAGFGVIAIKAIQEQQKELDELRTRLIALEEQNKQLKQLTEKK